MTLNPKNLLHGGDYMNLEKYELLTDVGQRIRARRLELHLSQDELAKLAGYKSRSSINKIEQGKNDIPQTKIQDIATALSTTVAYIMGAEPNIPTPDVAVDASEKELSLLKKYRRLDDVGKDTVDAVIDVQLKRLHE